MSAAASSDASSRRALAVAWMNRGHEALLCGDRPALESALAAYDAAIALLRPLVAATDADPSWVNSLGAALMNRGQLLHRLHGVAASTDALETFASAVAILGPVAQRGHRWARRNLAGTLLNRANLLLDLDSAAPALATAREALALTADAEHLDAIDADLALKARRAACDALGRLLVGAGDATDTLAAEASDVVDDALALIRHWSARGTAFRELALRFFRFGAQLYRLYQPHFLAEFIRENLPAGDAEFRAIAVAVAQSVLADRPAGQPFFTLGDTASERRLHTARELRSLLAEISVSSARPDLTA